MPPWLIQTIDISVTLFLVILNGFFVAAEFALVKVRGSQIDQLVEDKRPFAKTAKWLADRLEPSLSCCQLGITMASLALGWLGEPAFERLIEPIFQWFGIESKAVLHTVSVIVAFTVITAFHLVIGEQAPKIFAIRKPETMLLWCAVPLRFFFIMTYPLMAMLNWTTSVLLARLGLEESDGHSEPVSEQELRMMITESHQHGHLTPSEHSLLNAVFEFDDLVCRRVMVPRSEVVYLDKNASFAENLATVNRTKHTRFPIVDGTMDEVVGIVHIKDLVGVDPDGDFQLDSIARPPRKVPENLPISKLLKHFQATHQLMAMVVDEYGNVIGIVTLENVLEEIIGDVDDEFDVKQEEMLKDGPDSWVINGSVAADEVIEMFSLDQPEQEVDTFSGLLTDLASKVLSPGDEIPLGNFVARIIEVRDDRAIQVRVFKQTSMKSQAPDGSS